MRVWRDPGVFVGDRVVDVGDVPAMNDDRIFLILAISIFIAALSLAALVIYTIVAGQPVSS